MRKRQSCGGSDRCQHHWPEAVDFLADPSRAQSSTSDDGSQANRLRVNKCVNGIQHAPTRASQLLKVAWQPQNRVCGRRAHINILSITTIRFKPFDSRRPKNRTHAELTGIQHGPSSTRCADTPEYSRARSQNTPQSALRPLQRNRTPQNPHSWRFLKVSFKRPCSGSNSGLGQMARR